MKKLNLTPKAKKVSMITGAAVICLGVLSVVLFQKNTGSQIATASAGSSSVSAASETVAVNPITAGSSTVGSNANANSNGGTGTFDPERQTRASAPLTTISKPASAASKPVVQGESKNGSQPTNPVLTNKSKRPTYTTTPKAPTTSATTKIPSKSSGGSTGGGSHTGESYDPVFGWTKSTGGQGTTVGNPGDQLTGDKVGSMD